MELDKLIKNIHQSNPVKREKAIKTMCDACMGNPAQSKPAVAELNKLLLDGEIKISSYSAQTLVRIGKTHVAFLSGSITPMMDFVNHALGMGRNYNGSWTTVSEVVEAIGEVGAYNPSSGRSALGTLFKILNPPIYHPQNFHPGMEKVYAGAAHAVGLFANQSGASVKDVSPSLFKAMVDTYTYPRLVDDARNRNGFRWWVIYALLELGKTNPSYVIPSLVKALTHPNLEVRKKVIEILDSVASDPRTAVPPLVQCINSLDNELSKNAALTLGSLGQTTPEFVTPSLISLLQSQDLNVLKNSLTVVYTISKSSPASAADVKEYLIPLLNSQDNEVRLQAVRIFSLLGQASIQHVQETIPYLIYINMNDPSQAVKDEAVKLLKHIGVDVNKYTLTVEVLRQTQDLVSQLNQQRKNPEDVLKELQKSKDELIELNYEVALGSANKAYETATSLLSGKSAPTPTKVVQTAPPKAIAKKVEEQRTEQETLLKEYLFDSFVKGPNNSFALAAAKAVSENPSQAYNPLFVYSGAGLGKTHLLNAIGNHYKESSPLASVIYITSEKFTNELINSIQNNSLEEFRNRYRNVDILLIDDIQSIAGKERTQEEFFNTFNALFNNKKQIVISSDKPPSEIPTLEDRLRSRFEWGLITEIGRPDFETRVAILRNKSSKDGLNIEEDVLNIIANKEVENIRNLEGSFNEVMGYAELNEKPLTPEVAKEALKIDDVEKVDIEDMELDWGTTYISKEPTSDMSFKFYKALVAAGAKGICVSRVHPDKLKKRYKMKDENLFWLSKTPSEDSMSPTNISKMAHVLNTFIKENNNSILLMDGLEYLISNNDFKLVMRFLDDINEHVVVGHCVLILPITESTYSSKELTLLERNTVALIEDMITYANLLFEEMDDAADEPSKEDLLETQKKQEEILQNITNIQERINTARSLGLEVEEFDEGLKEIRELSNTKEYDSALNKATGLLKKVNDSIEGSLDKVSDILETAKETLKQAEELMVKTEEMDSLLNQAVGAFRLNMYEDALEYANKMIEKAKEPISYRLTVNLLKEAKDKITEARDNDQVPTKAEEYLKEAKPAILAKNYDEAQVLATRSINSAKKLLGEEVDESDLPDEGSEDDDSLADSTGIDAGSFSDIMDRINVAKEKLSKSMDDDGEEPKRPPKKKKPASQPKEEDDVDEDDEEEEDEEESKPSVKDGEHPICPKCDTLLLVGSRFCNQCGNTM